MEKVIKAAWAGVTANDRFICIQTYSGYRASQMDDKGALHYLDSKADSHELGLALLDAIEKSRFVASTMRRDVWMHPEVGVDAEFYDYNSTLRRYEEWVQATMSLYGYKTRKALFKGLHSCNAKCQNGVINIQPMKKDKGESWSCPSSTPDISVNIALNAQAEEVGAALRLALSRCT